MCMHVNLLSYLNSTQQQQQMIVVGQLFLLTMRKAFPIGQNAAFCPTHAAVVHVDCCWSFSLPKNKYHGIT